MIDSLVSFRFSFNLSFFIIFRGIFDFSVIFNGNFF